MTNPPGLWPLESHPSRPRRGVLPCLAMAVLLLAGCSRKYDILLFYGGSREDGSITAYSRPKSDGHGNLVYKDANGNWAKISELRVREINAR